MADERITPDIAEQVWTQAKSTGHATDAEPFAPCPPDCEVTVDHRHYQREAGVYFELSEPAPCCGREWARADEHFWLDACRWCWDDGKPFPNAIQLVPTHTVIRDAPRRRRR